MVKVKICCLNKAQTTYMIGSCVYNNISERKKRILVGLLSCAPCFHWLPLHDKQSIQSMAKNHLVSFKGSVSLPDGLGGVYNKFVTLTHTGRSLAEFVLRESSGQRC